MKYLMAFVLFCVFSIQLTAQTIKNEQLLYKGLYDVATSCHFVNLDRIKISDSEFVCLENHNGTNHLVKYDLNFNTIWNIEFAHSDSLYFDDFYYGTIEFKGNQYVCSYLTEFEYFSSVYLLTTAIVDTAGNLVEINDSYSDSSFISLFPTKTVPYQNRLLMSYNIEQKSSRIVKLDYQGNIIEAFDSDSLLGVDAVNLYPPIVNNDFVYFKVSTDIEDSDKRAFSIIKCDSDFSAISSFLIDSFSLSSYKSFISGILDNNVFASSFSIKQTGSDTIISQVYFHTLNGELVFVKKVAYNLVNVIEKVLYTNDNCYLLIGSTGGLQESTRQRICIKIDSLGNTIWQKVFDHKDNMYENLTDVFSTIGNQYALIGVSQENLGLKSTVYMATLTDDSYISVNESSGIENDKARCFPNPVVSDLNTKFENPNRQAATVSIYDVLGNKLFQNDTNSDNISLPTNTFSNGLYTVRIFVDNQYQQTQFIISR